MVEQVLRRLPVIGGSGFGLMWTRSFSPEGHFLFSRPNTPNAYPLVNRVKLGGASGGVATLPTETQPVFGKDEFGPSSS